MIFWVLAVIKCVQALPAKPVLIARLLIRSAKVDCFAS